MIPAVVRGSYGSWSHFSMRGQSHSNTCLWCRLHQNSSQCGHGSQVGLASVDGIDGLRHKAYTERIKYTVTIDPRAINDMRRLPAHWRKPIALEIRRLAHQARIRTEHRHPLEEPFESYWESGVGPYRIFYEFEEGNIVGVRSVPLKGKKRTDEVLEP